jgi:hypothetical protein
MPILLHSIATFSLITFCPYSMCCDYAATNSQLLTYAPARNILPQKFFFFKTFFVFE